MRLLSVLLISLALIRPALAAPDLRTILAASGISIENVDLLRDDLNAFYATRNDATVWNFNGQDNVNAFNGFLDSVTQVIDYHGLERDDYPLDAMRKLGQSNADIDKVHLELLVTNTLLQLAHELHGDENDLDQLYVGWVFHRADADIPAQLAAAINGNTLSNYINSLAPKSVAYEALAKALISYRAMQANGGWQAISGGAALRPKDRHPRVAQLRARLVAEDFLPKATLTPQDNEFFDDALAKALITWQTRNGLEPDGHVGANTLEALNKTPQDRIDQIRANMERWRHMPEDFPPDRYAVVNIASAEIDIFEAAKAIYRGIVVVGRTDRKTPFIDSKIRSMIINPFWHVPTKIAQKDILPKLRKDPHYLEKLGFVIGGDAHDPYGEHIDWKTFPARDFNFHLRQAPGDSNSLGRLKFDFNNEFAVYMHGTPHQELFAKAQRNFSSGCIRLRDPEQIAELLLAGNNGHWDVTKIEDEINTDKTRWVGLANPIPIYILYWTVFTDETGAINFRKDVYGYDAMLTGAVDRVPPSAVP